MPEPQRSIFREDAVKRYLQGREETVFPRLVSPRSIVFLWVLFALLLAAGVIAWWTEVPVYASGPAVAVGEGLGAAASHVAVVAFLPQESLSRLHAGQRLFLKTGASNDRRALSVRAVDETIYSPDAAQARFRLSGGAAATLRAPTAAVRAELPLDAQALPASQYRGTVYQADVEVGSRRIISLLPVAGRFFGE
jgi:hypothetical protein